MSDRTTGLFFIAVGAVFAVMDMAWWLSHDELRWAYVAGPVLWMFGLSIARSAEKDRQP